MHGMSERVGEGVKVIRFAIVLLSVAHLLLADGIVKELAAANLKGAAAVPVIPGLFNLAYVENRGCAWGLLQGKVWLLAVFAVVVLFFVIRYRKDVFCFGNTAAKLKFLPHVTEVLLYAGILGNLADRVFRGYVIDMFDFYFRANHFPCFNLADVYISVAAGAMLLLSITAPSKESASL